MGQEVELKLAVTPQAAARLAEDALFAPADRVQRLSATYFDTPGQHLRSAGVSLRVRSEDGVLVQTVKSAPAHHAGLFRRGEWTLPARRGQPVADPRTPVGALVEAAGEPLQPQFAVSARRAMRVLHFDPGTAIEVAIDTGSVTAGPRSEALAEVELELREGDAAALFALAHRIAARVPARIGFISKSARGWRLLNASDVSEGANLPMLAPAMPVGQAFAAIATACLVHYRANEDILLERRSEEAVHQARVALRRLRSAMRVFRPVIAADPRASRLDARLRALARTLGAVRDHDVMLQGWDPGPIRERLLAGREDAWRKARRRLGAKSTRLLTLDLAEWLECGAWHADGATLAAREAPLRPFAAARLDRLMRKVRRHGRHFADLGDEQRHRLRKELKKLRYAAEFFEQLFDGHAKAHKAFGKAMKHLQSDLGALNDIRVAQDWLAAHGLSDSDEARAWIEQTGRTRLLKKADDARRALGDLTPFWR